MDIFGWKGHFWPFWVNLGNRQKWPFWGFWPSSLWSQRSSSSSSTAIFIILVVSIFINHLMSIAGPLRRPLVLFAFNTLRSLSSPFGGPYFFLALFSVLAINSSRRISSMLLIPDFQDDSDHRRPSLPPLPFLNKKNIKKLYVCAVAINL